MKTYINNHQKIVSEKPEIFEVGRDYFNNPIYNNDLVYYFSEHYDNVHQLDKNFVGYSKNHFSNSVKIYTHQIPFLLTYLTRLVSKQTINLLNTVPKIGDIVVLKSHNSEFKVLDNTTKIFLKVQSLKNPDYKPVFTLNELK